MLIVGDESRQALRRRSTMCHTADGSVHPIRALWSLTETQIAGIIAGLCNLPKSWSI